MQFTALPLQTVLIFAGLAALSVTVLYLLKLRKRRIEVPFSSLWNRVLAEKRSTTDWWRRLKRLLSWLLHLLMVALVGFGLLGPHFEDEIIEGRNILILIDNSASMGAVDVSGGIDRLDIARRKATEILDTVSGDDRVMLATFNHRVQPLSPFVAEPGVLEQPLREITVAATGTNFEQALSFAADSLRDKSQAELVIISDGAGFSTQGFSDEGVETLDFGDQTTIRHLKVGQSTENLAITAFNARRYLANRLDFELFVQVQSFFDRPVEAELQLYADGRLVDTKALELDAGEIHRQFYPSQAVAGERLEARVRLRTRDARDVFPLDDSAFAVLPKTRKLQVQIVTEGNLFIEGPLLLNPNLEVTRVRPASYDPSRAFDVTIFDGVTPALPEAGNFVYFAPSGADSPFEFNGVVADPIITDVKRSHPLLRWLTLTDLNIGESARLVRRAGDDVVASSFGTPILMTRTDGARNFVVVGFDVRNSDFPLRVAFPVFIFNLLDYFSLDDGDFIPSYPTGETWTVTLPAGATRATMHTPSGASREVAVFDGQAVYYGEVPGIYRLSTDAGDMLLAANLMNLEESRIGPADIELPDHAIETSVDAMIFARHQIWVWIVLAFLALLLFEWLTYNRRITV